MTLNSRKQTATAVEARARLELLFDRIDEAMTARHKSKTPDVEAACIALLEGLNGEVGPHWKHISQCPATSLADVAEKQRMLEFWLDDGEADEEMATRLSVQAAAMAERFDRGALGALDLPCLYSAANEVYRLRLKSKRMALDAIRTSISYLETVASQPGAPELGLKYRSVFV